MIKITWWWVSPFNALVSFSCILADFTIYNCFSRDTGMWSFPYALSFIFHDICPIQQAVISPVSPNNIELNGAEAPVLWY